jgi:hypothetical protein
MRKRIFATAVIFMVLVSVASAQLVDQADIETTKNDYLGLKPASKPFSLIDLSKLRWSNSYSLSFYSGSGSSGSMGLYTTSLFYEFSRALSLDFQLGVAHNPGSLFNSDISSDAVFLPGFNLDYHPSNNFRISLGFERYPSDYFYNPYSTYRYLPWRYDQ